MTQKETKVKRVDISNKPKRFDCSKCIHQRNKNIGGDYNYYYCPLPTCEYQLSQSKGPTKTKEPIHENI